MATTTEQLELLYRVKGEAALTDAKQKLADLAQEEERLKRLFEQTAISEDALEKETRRLAAAKAQLTQSVEGLQRVQQGAATDSRGLNQALVQLGYAVDDAQYGFRGLSNNIQPFLQSLGGVSEQASRISPALGGLVGTAARLAGPLAIAATLSYEIYEHWDSIKGVFGATVDDGLERVEKLNDRIKELTDKPHKVAIEILELENARHQVDAIKAALEAVDRLSKSQAHYERQSGQAIEERLASPQYDFGGAMTGEELRRKLKGQIASSILANHAELPGLQKEMDSWLARHRAAEAEFNRPGKTLAETNAAFQALKIAEEGFKETAAKIEAIKQNVLKEGGSADVALGDVLARAEKGSGATQAAGQKQLADLLRKGGLNRMAESVEINSPESLQEIEATEEELDRSNEEAAARRKEREAAKREADAKAKEAERQRKEAERLAEEKARQKRLAVNRLAAPITRDVLLENEKLFEQTASDAAAQGKTQEQIRAAVREAARDLVAKAVKARGVSPEVGREALDDLAEKVAARAPSLAEQAEARRQQAARKAAADAKQKAEEQDRADERAAKAVTQHSTIDERATLFAADMASQGGDVGPGGAQRRLLENLVHQELQRAGVVGPQAVRLARKIAGDAADKAVATLRGAILEGNPGLAGAELGNELERQGRQLGEAGGGEGGGAGFRSVPVNAPAPEGEGEGDGGGEGFLSVPVNAAKGRKAKPKGGAAKKGTTRYRIERARARRRAKAAKRKATVHPPEKGAVDENRRSPAFGPSEADLEIARLREGNLVGPPKPSAAESGLAKVREEAAAAAAQKRQHAAMEEILGPAFAPQLQAAGQGGVSAAERGLAKVRATPRQPSPAERGVAKIREAEATAQAMETQQQTMAEMLSFNEALLARLKKLEQNARQLGKAATDANARARTVLNRGR